MKPTIEEVEKIIQNRKQKITDLKASEEIELVYLFGQKKEEITEELYEVILNYYEELLKDAEEWLERLKEEEHLRKERQMLEKIKEEAQTDET